MTPYRRFLLLTTLSSTIIFGCSDTTNTSDTAAKLSLNAGHDSRVPDTDRGVESTIPAELGGEGFTGVGWQTNTQFPPIGNPRALKGGELRYAIPDFPSTLRPEGPEVGVFNLVLANLVYETLLLIHPTTTAYVPSLATHWQISEDHRMYRFRIDPDARWSDGRAVTAEDVVASWTLWMDQDMRAPPLRSMLSNFELPVAESKYIVRVNTKTVDWRTFHDFAVHLVIVPAHIIKGLDAKTYVRDYDFKMIPGSGPYIVAEADVAKGQTIRIRRRKDYWASEYPRNAGLYNFDEIRAVVVRDRNLEFEMFKRGDLDYYYVNSANMWAQDLEFSAIQQGLLLKRRVWNNKVIGVGGMAMNTRRAPLDDVRVRKALRHLFNRELLIEKLMHRTYSPMDSYWPGTIYENPTNEKIKYDPDVAIRLLNDAGWKDRDSSGRLVRNGRPLILEVLSFDRALDRYLTIFQEDLRKVGIILTIRLLTPETVTKLIDERQFSLAAVNYAGYPLPDPDVLLSSLADQKNNRNITGFRNKRVDELITEYRSAYELDDRVRIIRSIDELYSNEHHWIYVWYAPYERFVFWNRFGTPPGYITRTGTHRDILYMWWFDPIKAQSLERARRDISITFEQGDSDDKYWLEYPDQRKKHLSYR